MTMNSNSYLEIAESCTWLQKVYLHSVSLIYGTNHEYMKMNYPIDYYSYSRQIKNYTMMKGKTDMDTNPLSVYV